MRVLLIGDMPPPVGGIATHVQQLKCFLHKHGIPVRVLDIGKGQRTEPEGEVIPTHSALALARGVISHAQKGWQVHLHVSGNNRKAWLVTTAVGALAKSAGPMLPLLTVHSGLMAEFVAASPANRTLIYESVRNYSAVIAVSDPVRDALLGCGVPESKIWVAPAFLADMVHPGYPPEAWVRLREHHAPWISFAHHPSPVYGTKLLFDAVAIAAQEHPELGVAAFGPGTASKEFRLSANAVGIGPRVHGLGELTHGETLAVMAGSDVFVRPTLTDGDSISVREALALGVPCVASNSAYRPSGTILFSSQDVSALVNALHRALETPRVPRVLNDASSLLLALYQRPGANRTQLGAQPHERLTGFAASPSSP